MKNQVSAVILDLDGTLLDTERATEGVLKNFLKKYEKDLVVDKEANRLGKIFKEIAASIIHDYNLPLTVDEYCSEIMPHYREKWSQVKALPGATRLLNYLHKHGIPFALASNSLRQNIDAKISYQQGWKEIFPVIIGGDEVKSGKPSPDIFLEAATRLNIDASQCLVIEDSLVGVTAAKSAGMNVVAVPSIPALANRYTNADSVLQSLLDFQPELWDLPPFEDWFHNVLPIQPIHLKGRIQQEVSNGGHELLILVLCRDSADFLPNQMTGVFIGWAREDDSEEAFKVVMANKWEECLGTARRVTQVQLVNGYEVQLHGKELEMFITGYIRQLGTEGILARDSHIADDSLDLPCFTTDRL